MTVYVINNMTIQDMEEYKAYVKAFMPVFQEYGGRVLAALNHPVPAEGEWTYDRTVLLAFPSRALADAWSASPDYEDVAKRRWASTRSNVLVLDGLHY